MKVLALLVLFLACCCSASPLSGGDTKDEAINDGDIKWEMKYLEKTWGIKFKGAVKTTATVLAGKDRTSEIPAVKITLEFTKDLEDVKELQRTFKPWSPAFDQKNPPGMHIHFFDGDNVQIAKGWIQVLHGELSGKAGDAFRIVVLTPGDLKKVKKIEPRAIEAK